MLKLREKKWLICFILLSKKKNILHVTLSRFVKIEGTETLIFNYCKAHFDLQQNIHYVLFRFLMKIVNFEEWIFLHILWWFKVTELSSQINVLYHSVSKQKCDSTALKISPHFAGKPSRCNIFLQCFQSKRSHISSLTDCFMGQRTNKTLNRPFLKYRLFFKKNFFLGLM